MVDLHCHLLPGVDDGARSLSESLQMAALALQGGTTVIAATPHANLPGGTLSLAAYEKALEELRRALRDYQMPLTVLRGMEVFSTGEELSRFAAQELYTLNFGRYVLVEFAFDEQESGMTQRLLALRRVGLFPVVAHPERYEAVQEAPDVVCRWMQAGCFLQGNQGSLLGELGTMAFETAWTLLRRGRYTCIASDAHDPVHRTPDLRPVQEALLSVLMPSQAHELLTKYPAAILRDQPLPGIREKTSRHL